MTSSAAGRRSLALLLLSGARTLATRTPSSTTTKSTTSAAAKKAAAAKVRRKRKKGPPFFEAIDRTKKEKLMPPLIDRCSFTFSPFPLNISRILIQTKAPTTRARKKKAVDEAVEATKATTTAKTAEAAPTIVAEVRRKKFLPFSLSLAPSLSLFPLPCSTRPLLLRTRTHLHHRRPRRASTRQPFPSSSSHRRR